MNQLTDEIEIVVSKIFYSPATNGQAEESIKAGIGDVEKLISEALTSERQRGKGLMDENEQLKRKITDMAKEYNELWDQAQRWKEESGN